VLFTGFRDNPYKFVSRCDVFVLPSLHEAQPIALVEAMTVGCAIVAYDCPVGPRELLAPGTAETALTDAIECAQYGLLVPTGNVAILAKAIAQLLENASLRNKYARLGSERASHFNMKDMTEKYLKVLSAAAGIPQAL
jgi:N-acetylgalactosamine-N,N'-diacetylbacillosaminyl-diphospho-undecaprenol 4-alpha-N-acetylgalactosaminyltransferase